MRDLIKEWNNPFISLQNKNFRRYWIGMCVSVIGTWMQNIAQPWLAYSLTKSPLLLSLVSMVQFLPVLLLSLFAGVIIDRFPKKKIILFTQSAALITTFILGVLVWSGSIRYWHILVLATMLGFINTMDMPARHSFVTQLVEKEHLMNAIALNSMAFNFARIIGPTVAGIIMGYLGIEACFLINSFSFAIVLISLLTIKIINQEVTHHKSSTKIYVEIIDGLKYIRKSRELFITFLFIASVTIFAGNNSVMLPVFTNDILGLNETYYGVIMSIMGIGSFLGAMCLAAISRGGPKRRAIFVTPFLIAFFIGVTGFTNFFVFTGLTLAMSGFFFIIFSSSANTLIQLNAKDAYRGRVMSVYNLVFGGTLPLGNLIIGFVVDRFNARIGFYTCGSSIMVLMILWILIYRRLNL